MSNKTYDFLKWIAQVFIPAAATLYFAVAEIWRLPYKAEVIGTASAVDAFLGALLQISSIKWNADWNAVLSSGIEEEKKK